MDQQPTPPPPSALPYGTKQPPSALSGLWWCSGLGLLVLFVFPRTLQWLSSALFGTHFEPFELDGVVVPYLKTDAFWSDLGPTSLGLMLIVEGLSYIAGRRKSLLVSALFLVAVCTMYNLGYAAGNIRQNIPIISLIALIVGLPMTVDLFKRTRALR